MTIAPAALGYSLLIEADRISAVTPDGVEIAGAYKPAAHQYWSVHVSALIVRCTPRAVFPRHIPYSGLTARHDAEVLVECFAATYTRAVS